MEKQRREHRIHIDIRVECEEAASGKRVVGRATDISLGGLRVEATSQLAFGAAVLVHIRLPGAATPLALEAVVRWTRPDAIGLQFGLMGARETHLIADLALAGSQTLDASDVAWVG